MTEKLKLVFDPNTIEHLGISLYSKLPSVLSELISNSWDADADTVLINFSVSENSKEIHYTDDGNGMDFQELQEKYLVIGRNRRKDTQKQVSDIKKRKVIGKKGLGKLSVFGICDTIEVISVKNGFKNHFKMNLEDIRNSQGEYEPEIILKNEKTDDEQGTILYLKNIRRKSAFDLDKIALSLSKKFLIFEEMKTSLYSNNSNEIEVTNDLKFKELKTQFEWKFPEEKYDNEYEHWEDIQGTIFTLETPVKDTEMRGLYLTSRGKIVNTAGFYGARDNDQFHSYVTGYLEVDFIDDFDEDVISTDRHSLNWENEKTRELQEYIHKIIKKIGAEWKNKRAGVKKDSIVKTKDLDIDKWQKELPTYERELSNKIIEPILENSNIDVNESSEIIGNVIDKFNNQTFKEYASKIADISKPEDIPALLELMDDWKAIESKQFKDLAYSRIEVIKQFEEYINTNTKEVPTLHNFLKKFSWLLDPRILEFRDEVTYSKLLKESFPEDKLDEPNKRIDFLCSNALGEILYVIEIKRSQFKIDEKALEQAAKYGAFLRNKYASQTGFSKVVCYVVGGQKSDDYEFIDKEDTYIKSGKVFVKTYRELLEQSKEYHKEFIEAYDQHN
ncbi:ATP-binding protein [Aquimarina longa]|uniref:ATP-binding protein n=1 Tax=Aquimarina longa TaxID=1080221 RepID=UPI000781C1E9|nr:ATP-binding protein [Aquimarina longa]